MKSSTIVNEKKTKEASTTKAADGGKRQPRKRFFRRPRPFSVEVVLCEDASEAQLPARKTSGSCGSDLRALYDGVIPAHGMLTGVRTGIKIKPSRKCVGWITPRSGMSSVGITIINSPGEIDSDYRGELLINFANLSDKDFKFKAGNRIAQITFSPVFFGNFNIVEEFSHEKVRNERGENGFGSTGMNDPEKVEDEADKKASE